MLVGDGIMGMVNSASPPIYIYIYLYIYYEELSLTNCHHRYTSSFIGYEKFDTMFSIISVLLYAWILLFSAWHR